MLEVGMSVKGSLEAVGLEDLLQANLASQGGGRLTLRQGAQYAALYLDADGLYVVQPDLVLPSMLLESFVERGLLDAEVLTRARKGRSRSPRTSLSPDLDILDTLVADGHVPEAEFMEILATEVEDTILDMLLWDEGWFRFESEPKDTVSLGLLGRICVDAEGVRARALEHIEERRLIGDVLGDRALLFVSAAGDLPPLEDENDPLHAVHAQLNGSTIVHEIALRLGRGRFEILRTITRLVGAGLARLPTGDELLIEASERTHAGQHVLARRLILQWAETRPDDPEPLRRLASLAKDADDLADGIEALCALGHLHLRLHETAEALDVFSRAMRMAPADDVVLAGLRIAAEAAGDNDAVVDSTLLTAQTKLDEGKPLEALTLLEGLQATHPTNMAAHLLRARALVQSEQRAEFFEHAEAVGRVLASEGCRSKANREAAEFFQETIAQLAPDRGDLLERFRSLHDSRRGHRRTLALLVALVLLIAGAGVHFWPASAASLLSEAQEAANDGDKAHALTLIGRLADRFPDAPETQEAFLLQGRIMPPRTTTSHQRRALDDLRTTIEKKMPAFRAALPQLPSTDAKAPIQEVLTALAAAQAKPLRTTVLRPVAADLRKTTMRLDAAALARVTILARVAGILGRLRHEPEHLRAFLDEAEQARDAEELARLKAASALLYRVARLADDEALVRLTKAFVRSADGLAGAAAYYDEHAAGIRRSLASIEIEEADRRCREQAPRLMVAGRIDEADALYARLETLLGQCQDNPLYARLMQSVERRQLPQLIQQRRSQVRDIRARMARAKAAEAKGDLAGAVALYAALVKEYWLIRFETLFTLPLRVETVPPGARVTMNGREVGRTPTVVRYAWDSKATVSVSAPGYTTETRALLTAEDHPPSHLMIEMTPTVHWSRGLKEAVRLAPVALGDDVLIIARSGALTRRDGTDGHVRWRLAATSLEGVRGKPALMDDTLYVPHVDGRVVLVDVETGTQRGALQLPRLTGDAAALGTRVAVLTEEGALLLLPTDASPSEGKAPRRIDLEAAPAAGVLAAHGAFWVGTLEGALLRVDPVSGKRRAFAVGREKASLLALGADAQGLYVTTSRGAIVGLAPDGSTRWRRDAVGDVIGAPVRAGARVGVVLRSGRVLFFDAKDGTPGPVVESGGTPLHGAVADGTTLFLVRRDGRPWACESEQGHVLLDGGTPFPARFGPALLSGGRLALAWPARKGERDARVAVVSVPRRP